MIKDGVKESIGYQNGCKRKRKGLGERWDGGKVSTDRGRLGPRTKPGVELIIKGLSGREG